MPQIRCPSCGTTINLENRKAIDFSLILKALGSRPKSFSELLRVTRLPRKTLYLRLKELCEKDAITKDGLYYINEACPHKEWQGKIMEENSRIFNNRRIMALLLILCVGLPIGGNAVFAMFAQTPSPPEPEPLGSFTAIVIVNGVSEVYGWQIGLQFNFSNLKMITWEPGDFLTPEEYDIEIEGPIYKDTLIYKAVKSDRVIVGQTLRFVRPGISGSGTLAVIEFEYYQSFEAPTFVFGNEGTMLVKPDTSEIPSDSYTLEMSIEPATP